MGLEGSEYTTMMHLYSTFSFVNDRLFEEEGGRKGGKEGGKKGGKEGGRKGGKEGEKV